MKWSNNVILFTILLVLLGGFVVTKFFRTPSLESNLEEHILTIDTSRVSAIHIHPAAEDGEIKLLRAGQKWKVERDETKVNVEVSHLRSALGSISKIRPERLLSRKKEKWADYQVDSTGTNVKVYSGKEDPTEFWIGKTSSGGNSLRIEGNDNVYEVKEALEGNFNRRFAGWRDKTLLKIEPEKITKISFEYPSDSSFIVERSNGKWNINNMQADSAKVATYLNRFRSRTLSEFADNFTPPDKPEYIVTLNNDSASALTLRGWKTDDNQWVVTSSLQDQVYFSSDDKNLMNQLFAGKNAFISK
jgi:hypothetical protein